jgi:GNAT superfamily N-acetyltransferase
MCASREDVAVAVAHPRSPQGRAVLRAYFGDIVSRYYGRPATDGEIDAAMREEPSDDLAPPSGLLFLARAGGAVIGCAGLRLLGDGTGEVTRVFVVPAARGQGVGSQLLRVLEEAAREHQVSRLRLDTRSDLTEARRLYARNGYHDVPPFNDGRYADHWYEKTLA